jgi:xanthine dehydrogenase accessory factor
MNEEDVPEAVTDDWPIFGLTDDVRPALDDAVDAGAPVALATLYASDGGAPRGIGAQMLVSRNTASGYVSGGCVEADIARHAQAVIESGEPACLVYGRGGPVDIRLPCGGRIELLVERLMPDDAAAIRLLELGRQRTPALWLTTGRTRAVLAPGESETTLPAALQDAARRARDRDPATADALHRIHEPRRRLVVLGSDPTSLAIATLAAPMGGDVHLVRPRGPERAPSVAGLHYHRTDAAQALAGIGLDPWTSVVVAMHDELNDHEALMAALPSRAFYVGLLGSRRRLAEKLERLRRAGLSDADLARLHAPIGLPIGGFSPWEIALSVLAEITQEANAAKLRIWPEADARAA